MLWGFRKTEHDWVIFLLSHLFKRRLLAFGDGSPDKLRGRRASRRVENINKITIGKANWFISLTTVFSILRSYNSCNIVLHLLSLSECYFYLKLEFIGAVFKDKLWTQNLGWLMWFLVPLFICNQNGLVCLLPSDPLKGLKGSRHVAYVIKNSELK